MKQAIFVSCVIAIAVSLVAISTLTDVGEAPTTWTYDEDDKYFLNEWKEAGGGDFSTWGFPENVLKQFDITARSLPAEVFFSKEFQSALYASRQPFSITTDPQDYLQRLDPTLRKEQEFAFSTENEKRKLAAISRLRNLDELPAETLAGLELQRDHYNRMNERLLKIRREGSEPQMYATRPVDEVFIELHPMDQRTLEPYRERLTGFFAIQETLQEMSDSEREAAFRLLTLMRKPIEEPPRLPPEYAEKLRLEFEQGYRLVPDELATTKLLKQQIESRASKPSFFPFGRRNDGEVAFRLDSAEARDLVKNLSPVPIAYILPNSENFIVRVPRQETWARYYSSTVFGGAVAIQESEVTDVSYSFSNLTIAGRDAFIMHQLHKDHHWVTRISAFNGRTRFVVTADGKLEGNQRDAYIEFCRLIVDAEL
ncbi:MAG: hypothetical protein OXG15_06500 [Gammaproteobacteria bacterium]|nr:hypothetical protein [Gammaproteobacteria bacterium]